MPLALQIFLLILFTTTICVAVNFGLVKEATRRGRGSARKKIDLACLMLWLAAMGGVSVLVAQEAKPPVPIEVEFTRIEKQALEEGKPVAERKPLGGVFNWEPAKRGNVFWLEFRDGDKRYYVTFVLRTPEEVIPRPEPRSPKTSSREE